MHAVIAPENLEAARDARPTGAAMIIPTLLGLAVVLSIASLVLGLDESDRDRSTPPGELPFWARYGRG
jgi:hypothetical protein